MNKIDRLMRTINNALENYAHLIVVNNQKTLELYNYKIILNADYINEFLVNEHYANLITDEIERFEIIQYFVHQIDKFRKDLYSRQIVYQPKYQDNENLAACLSCVQCIVRHNRIDIHVFIRSQNFDNNFLYDCQTFSILMEQMSKLLSRKIGFIYINIISLHKIL